MKLKNIELLMKNAKGIGHQIKLRNTRINMITSFGYQLTSAETADRIFTALLTSLDERKMLENLSNDVKTAFAELTLFERQVLNQMSCKEKPLKEATEHFKLPLNEVRAAYRRAMRKMSVLLYRKGYDELTLEMFVGEDGILLAR